MKQRLIQYLACPDCGGEVRVVKTVSQEGDEILAGALECVSCPRQFPIVGGVPRFADLESVDPEKAAIASSFGFEWKHFTQEDERYSDQFLGWITPVTPEFFKDKVELDGSADDETVFFVSHRHAFAGCAARYEDADAARDLVFDQVAQARLVNGAAGGEGGNESRRAAAQPVELYCHSDLRFSRKKAQKAQKIYLCCFVAMMSSITSENSKKPFRPTIQ